MKKILIAATLALATLGFASTKANADCYMTSYSIVHNWAEGTCVGSRGNVYELRMSYIDWVLDYGL